MVVISLVFGFLAVFLGVAYVKMERYCRWLEFQVDRRIYDA